MDYTVNQRLADAINYAIKNRLAYNQTDLAKSMGVSRSILSDIKSNSKVATEHYVLKLCTAYPIFSKDWLLTGEGEMLKPSIQEVHNGNNNTQIAGNNNHVNTQCTIDKAIEEIAEQRKLTTKAQEQIDRLLSIIENMSNSLSRNE